MFPPIVGLMALVAALGAVGLGLIVIVMGTARRARTTKRTGVRMVVWAVAGFGVVWALGVIASPTKRVSPGGEVSFCTLDCHLHVSVVRVDQANDLGVVLRFRSSAKAALEYPGELTIEVVDSAGRRFPPTSGLIAEPLDPGAALEREFRFAIPAGTHVEGITLRYDGWMDYLVPGTGNPLAQRKVKLSLSR